VIVDPSQIPVNLFALLGISVASAMASNTISSVKGLIIERPPPVNLPPYSTILEENGRVKLTRLQMFWWTLITIIVYVLIFYSQINETISGHKSLEMVSVPDINMVFVILTAFSQAIYLGGKFFTPLLSRITEIRPNRAPIGSAIFVLGSNFGSSQGISKGTIWFEDYSNNKFETPTENILEWTPYKIKVRVPSILMSNSQYYVRIEIAGMLTFVHEETKFTTLDSPKVDITQEHP